MQNRSFKDIRNKGRGRLLGHRWREGTERTGSVWSTFINVEEQFININNKEIDPRGRQATRPELEWRGCGCLRGSTG